jgi:hypothetical protein
MSLAPWPPPFSLLLLRATLQLLGERTWWFPAWLDRRLPRFALEPPEEPVNEGEEPLPVLEPMGGRSAEVPRFETT